MPLGTLYREDVYDRLPLPCDAVMRDDRENSVPLTSPGCLLPSRTTVHPLRSGVLALWGTAIPSLTLCDFTSTTVRAVLGEGPMSEPLPPQTKNPSATFLPVECQLQPLKKADWAPFPIIPFKLCASSEYSFSCLITHGKCSSLSFIISGVIWEAAQDSLLWVWCAQTARHSPAGRRRPVYFMSCIILQ